MKLSCLAIAKDRSDGFWSFVAFGNGQSHVKSSHNPSEFWDLALVYFEFEGHQAIAATLYHV
jgi:hypothetical protein